MKRPRLTQRTEPLVRIASWFIASWCLLGLFASWVSAEPIPISTVQRNDLVNFEREILPLLQRSCLACHSASEKQGALVLESPATMRQGGDSGPALIPGRGADSLMLRLASRQDEPLMPPEGNDVKASTLSSDELGLLRLWIDQGARGGDGVAMLSPKNWQAMPARIGPVYAVALTEDGQFVAASRSNKLYLYHVPTGREVAQLSDDRLKDVAGRPLGVAHRDLVQSLTFNRDGDLLASGGFREVKLWRRPRDVQQFQHSAGGEVTTFAISPDKQRYAVATQSKILVRNLQAEAGESVTLNGHSDVVTSMRFSSDGTRLASSSHDGSVRLWDVDSQQEVGRVHLPTSLAAVEFIATTKPTEELPHPPQIIAAAGEDRIIRTFHVPTSAPSAWKDLQPGLKLASISPDRTTAALVHAGGEVRIVLLGAGQGSLVASWKLEPADVTAVALHFDRPDSPAERTGTLITGHADGAIRAWSTREKRLVASWRGGDSPVASVAVSSNGQSVASGSDDGALAIWEMSAESTTPLEGNTGNAGTATAYARNAAGTLVATAGSVDGKPAIVLRDLESGKILSSLTGHSGEVTCIAFSWDGQTIAIGTADQLVYSWSVAKPADAIRSESLGGAVNAIAFSRDNKQILTAVDASVRSWAIDEPAAIREFSGHTGRVQFLSVGADSVPYSVAEDNTVRFWNLSDGKQLRTFNLPSKPKAVGASADGQRIAVAGEDRKLLVIQLNNGQTMLTAADIETTTKRVEFSAAGKQLLVADGGDAAEFGIWNLTLNPPRREQSYPSPKLALATWSKQTGQVLFANDAGAWSQFRLRLVRRLEGMTKPVRDVAFLANDQTLIAAAEDGALRGFTVANGQASFSASHGAAITGLAVSADGQVIASAGANKIIRLWRTNGSSFSPSQIAGLSGTPTAIDFSASGLKLLVAYSDGQTEVDVIDRQTAKVQQRFPGHKSPPLLVLATTTATTSNPEINDVLSMSADAIWNWQATPLMDISGHSGPITSLAAVPNLPAQLLSGSEDSTGRLWNTTTAALIRQFSVGGPVTAVAVRPDGQRIATATANRGARLWNLNGQSVAELRGDLRMKATVVRRTQQELAANARVKLAKQRLDAAKKNTPQKVEAEKKATEALAKANKDVEDMNVALTKVRDTKVGAEKLAIAASAKARLAFLAKSQADENVKLATAQLVGLQQRANQLSAVARTAPDDEGLKQLAQQAAETVAASQKSIQELQKLVPTLSKQAQDANNAANQETQKATKQQKPFNDALAALATASAAQNLASQQHVLAERECAQAKEFEPRTAQALAVEEAAQIVAQKMLEEANAASTAAEMPVRGVAFSPDGKLLATAGDFGSAHTWDAETGLALAAYAGHETSVSSVDFVAYGHLLTGGLDQSVRSWELNPHWRLEKTLGGNEASAAALSHRILALDFDDDARQLLVAGGTPSRNGELSVFAVDSGERKLYLPQAHDDVVHSARFSPDGKRIASAGADRYVRTFDVASSTQLRRFEGHTNYVLGVAWKGDGQTLASSAADNTVKIWDAETADQKRTISNFGKHVTAIKFVGETDTIVSSCGDNSVRMHNSANGGNVRSFGGTAAWVHCVDVIPSSLVVAAGTAGGTLYVWNGTNGQQIQKLEIGAVFGE